MASCAQVESLAQAYLDGELNPSETLVFEQHLGECRICAHTLERQKNASAMMFDAFAEFRQPRSLVPDIMAHLPEMDDSRLVRQMNQRAKQQKPSRLRLFFTVLSPVATVLLLVMGLALFYSWPGQEKQVSAQAIGMVTYTAGSVRSLLPRETNFQVAELQAPIARNQIFETAPGASMIASIAGPSTVKMADGGRVKVNDDRRIGLQNGKIWLHVAKSMRGARVFRVHTPDGDVTVFGTTFGVEVMQGKTLVTLLEGEVTVENDLTFATLRPNEQIELKRGVSPLQPYAIDAASALAWADQIQPDGVAQAAFLANIHPAGETILRAEHVWIVDTGDHAVTSVSFEWAPQPLKLGLCGYVVYVTDDSNKPLFAGHIDARELMQPDRTELEIPVPGGALAPHSTVFIRLVPDTATGSVQTDFKEVAFVGQ